MPLDFKKEPAEVKEAVESGLSRMTKKQAFSTPNLKRAIVAGVVAPIPQQAIPVYNMGLSELAEGKSFNTAKQNAWRYIIKQSDEVVASADVAVGPEGKQALAQVNEGPLVAGTIEAIKAANAQETVKNGQYEARLLMIPALYVAALWLVDTAGKLDYMMPVKPTPPFLEENKLYTIDGFRTIMQKVTKEKIASQPKGEPVLGA
jgi:hypothetical protein